MNPCAHAYTRQAADSLLLCLSAVLALTFLPIVAVANPSIDSETLKKARTESGAPAIGAMFATSNGAPSIKVDGVRELGKPDVVTADDRWHVGSVAKSMTSTLIGRLVDQGKLRWDTTLVQLLPGTPMREAYKAVTLLQLTQHRGGIVALTRPNAELNKLVNETPGDQRAKTEAAARWMLDQAPVAPPGTKLEYSNGGYALLGYIIERTMQEDYRALMKREVFVPLGMTSTDFGWPTDVSATAPRGHGPAGPNLADGIEPAPAAYRLPPHLDPAGNVHASLTDLARYLQAHLAALKGSDKFLKPATANQLHTPPERGADGRGYASGWSISTLPAVGTRHGHNGSAGTFYAEVAFVPERGVVAAVVTNAAPRPDQRPPVQSVLLRDLLNGSAATASTK
jgi:CubicO group peptidase (beta-lactamase class C family)